MVVQFSVEVNRKRRASISPRGQLLPSSKPARLRVFYSGTDMFDVAALWQSGFRHTTSALGTHLTSAQFDQLCGLPGRVVYIVFDQDPNQAGQRAARALAQRFAGIPVAAFPVPLPAGHDPSSYFLSGAGRNDFIDCLQRAPWR
jgi:hypothetical protein